MSCHKEQIVSEDISQDIARLDDQVAQLYDEGRYTPCTQASGLAFGSLRGLHFGTRVVVIPLPT